MEKEYELSSGLLLEARIELKGPFQEVYVFVDSIYDYKARHYVDLKELELEDLDEVIRKLKKFRDDYLGNNL